MNWLRIGGELCDAWTVGEQYRPEGPKLDDNDNFFNGVFYGVLWSVNKHRYPMFYEHSV
jgi:hypothetical protein